MIAKDVLCHSVIIYQKVEPCEDGSGCKMTAVFCVDTAGSLPDFIKKKIAEENAKGPEKLIKNLRKKKGLE